MGPPSLISDCRIDSGDDAICVKANGFGEGADCEDIVVAGCTLRLRRGGGECDVKASSGGNREAAALEGRLAARLAELDAAAASDTATCAATVRPCDREEE